MIEEELAKQFALPDRMVTKIKETHELRILNNRGLKEYLRRRDVKDTLLIYHIFNSRIFSGVLSVAIGSVTTVLSHDIALGSYLTLGSFYLERLVPKMMYATSICDSLTVKEIDEEKRVAADLDYRYNLRLVAYNLVFDYLVAGEEAILEYLKRNEETYPISVMLEDDVITSDKKVVETLRYISLLSKAKDRLQAKHNKEYVKVGGKESETTK